MRNHQALFAIALLIFLGCSSSTQLANPHDSGLDVKGDAPSGVTYACQAGGSDSAASEGAGGSSMTCVVGQTFCHVEVFNSGTATPSCMTFTDTSRSADCSGSPNCACLCNNALFFHCQTECRCNDDGGLVTVTCQQI